MPDYDFPNAGEEGSGIGTTVAGIVGAALTCLLAGAAGFVIHRVKNRWAKAHSDKARA